MLEAGYDTELQFQARHLYQLFDCLSDTVFAIKDCEGRYVHVSEGFATSLAGVIKIEDGNFIGRCAADVFDREGAKACDEQDALVLSSGQALRDQIELVPHKDGALGWFLTDKFPIFNDSGEIIGIAAIVQDLGTTRDSEHELDKIKTIVEYIQHHLAEPLNTENLASRVGFSAKQLDRRMKRFFRLSTKKYITKSRVDAAMELLNTTEMPISEIALLCGFSEQSTFTRQFAATVKSTPLAFRKSHRKAVGV